MLPPIGEAVGPWGYAIDPGSDTRRTELVIEYPAHSPCRKYIDRNDHSPDLVTLHPLKKPARFPICTMENKPELTDRSCRNAMLKQRVPRKSGIPALISLC